jgi:hypothetical protein
VGAPSVKWGALFGRENMSEENFFLDLVEGIMILAEWNKLYGTDFNYLTVEVCNNNRTNPAIFNVAIKIVTEDGEHDIANFPLTSQHCFDQLISILNKKYRLAQQHKDKYANCYTYVFHLAPNSS